ncbi:hypothetical protein E5K00_09290 [Hymenobacter aquaticus]|uniref:Uncharacterized protein n=1 Tax=Hymenobacter aquaticus TaxID=1867101 RepID=A0A4Z0Q9G2_9BACT|nr:hypothetical protein [Hymenobacter aquaticus]TGE25362.1 hypothetical protein E5K00_09290 [Hymenobacter aquaticus]
MELPDLSKIKVYAALALLAYGSYVWASLHGIRLLGDDNETTENINGTGSHSSGHAGRSSFYHK